MGTEPKTVTYASACKSITRGCMVDKPGITTRWRSHFLRRAIKNGNHASEATRPSDRVLLLEYDHSWLAGRSPS